MAGTVFPTKGQSLIPQALSRPDFVYRLAAGPVAVFIDGPVHDDRPVAERDAAAEDRLLDLGMLVIGSGTTRTEGWQQTVRKHPGIFGPADGPVVAGTVLKGTASPPGSLVKARGRDWVVLPDAAPGLLVARPLNGDPELVTGLFADEVQEATFPKPATGRARWGQSRCRAAPNRAAGGFHVQRRPVPLARLDSGRAAPYQLVPLLLALRLDVVRLLDRRRRRHRQDHRGRARSPTRCSRGRGPRLAVLCSPAPGRAVAGRTAREVRHRCRAGPALHRQRGWSARFAPTSRSSTLPLHGRLHRLHQVRPPDATSSCSTARSWSSWTRPTPASPAGERGQRHASSAATTAHALAADRDRHLILVTATPHSGNEDAFRDLLGLLDPDFADLDLTSRQRPRPAGPALRAAPPRATSAATSTRTPRSRATGRSARPPTSLTGDYRDCSTDVLAYARETVAEASGCRSGRCGSGCAGGRRWPCSAPSPHRPRAAAATLRTRPRRRRHHRRGSRRARPPASLDLATTTRSTAPTPHPAPRTTTTADRRRYGSRLMALAQARPTALEGAEQDRQKLAPSSRGQGAARRRLRPDRLLPVHPDRRVRGRALADALGSKDVRRGGHGHAAARRTARPASPS